MNNKKLTLTEALCIIQSGWGISDVEKKLFFEASDLISNEVQRVRLEYQKQLIEEKLQDLKATNNKQSSIDWLVEKMLTQDWYTYKSLEYIKQAKAMHNEELKEMYLKGIQNYDPTFKK